jgi:nitroreductase
MASQWPDKEHRVPMNAPVEVSVSPAEMAAALIHARQTILPKRLSAPGPDAAQLEKILDCASAAPDHHSLVPWRFVIVPAHARERLAEVFAASLLERDAAATAEQVAQAREKAYRAPLLLLAVFRSADLDDEVLPAERLLSAGCAIQNMLLMATALGFGSALTSGKALQSAGLRRLFQLTPDEQALCFISVGTAIAGRAARPRPRTSDYVSTLPPPAT